VSGILCVCVCVCVRVCVYVYEYQDSYNTITVFSIACVVVSCLTAEEVQHIYYRDCIAVTKSLFALQIFSLLLRSLQSTHANTHTMSWMCFLSLSVSRSLWWIGWVSGCRFHLSCSLRDVSWVDAWRKWRGMPTRDWLSTSGGKKSHYQRKKETRRNSHKFPYQMQYSSNSPTFEVVLPTKRDIWQQFPH